MKKFSISILLLFVMVLSITAVAAADDVTSDLAKSQIADDSAALAVDDGTDVLAADGGNFTDLQKDVDAGQIIIKDYTRADNNKEVVISGNTVISGSTIDAANKGGIFNITSTGKLTLVDVTLKNGNSTFGSAILNNGVVEIQGTLKLEGNNATLGGVIYNNGVITFNSGKINSTSTTGTDLYNAKDGQTAIAATSKLSGDVYNEGTLSTAGATYEGKFINNGTIDSINGDGFANGIENYGTVAKINATDAYPIAIVNNGTITSMKGKYGDVTNNGEIGTINATLTGVLTNNGTIEEIVESNLGIFRNYGNITSFDAVNLTNSISNYENATIGAIKNLVTDKHINNYGNIVLVDNVTVSGNFNNYGNVDLINNSTLSTSRNYENATIGIISSTVFKKSLSNYVNASIGIIEDTNITAKLNNDGTIIAIDNVNVGDVATINGNISNITDSVFNANVIISDNVNIKTIDNVTFKGEFTSENSENVTIGTIENCVFEGFVNDANITNIINSTFNGLLDTDHATIGTIDRCVFNAGLANYGDNVINNISKTLFNNTYVSNSGNITIIEDSFFNASSVYNEGILAIDDSLFAGNDGVNYVVENYGNLTIDESLFDSNVATAAIIYSKKGNLTIDVSYLINNTATHIVQVNNNTLTIIEDSLFANNTGSNVIRTQTAGILAVADSLFDNNNVTNVIYNQGTIAAVVDSEFTNVTNLAIKNQANLILSGNIINTTSAKISNEKTGFITAVKITVLDNKTKTYNYYDEVNLTATLTDDMGNWIYDQHAFSFLINGSLLDNPNGYVDGDGYNSTTGVYYLPIVLSACNDKNLTNDNHVVSAVLDKDYVNATLTVENGTIETIKGSFTELQFLIDDAIDKGATTYTLPYNFAYNDKFDNVNLTKGVVLNNAITIEGNGSTISGANVARIFLVNATVQIKNMTLMNGKANNGGAICINGSAYIYNVTFTDNVAAANGGAIYANGTYVTVAFSTFKNNTANVGNAIYVNAGRLNEYNNTISKTSADIVNFNGTLANVNLNITVLGNKTINATYGEAVTLTAFITDANGNLINDPFFYFTIDGANVSAIFDADSNIYSADTKLFCTPAIYEVSVKHNKTLSATLPIFNVATGAYNISKEASAVVVMVQDVIAGQNATVELMAFGANGDNLNNTNITVVVNNVPYNVTITDGYGNLTLPVLGLGTYRVYADYAGDANHNASSAVSEFGVKIGTVMTIAATNTGYDSALIKITLTDANGYKLSKFVTLTVGESVYDVVVKNGEGSQVVTGLKPGAYNAVAAFEYDPEYANAYADTTFTVAPGTIVAENIKRGVNSPFDYYATFVDAKGNPIAGKEITFVIDGKTLKATTDASGIAKVSAGLTLVNDTDTVYSVVVTNPDTGANTTATTTIVPRLIVVSGDLTADYLENPPYVVQAIGDDGNPVGAGETVRVVFAGFYYDLQTNATGHVVRTIGLAPGMYAVKACYQGYNTTATVFVVNQILKVTSGTLKLTAKSYTLKATLKNTNGKAIAGKEVKLTFNGKTYKVKTNSKGVASYKISSSVIKKLKAGKTYTLQARYVNDIAKGKIKVVKK